ncbi:MAG: hypothetical protein QXL88_00805 [Candidatus Pacearchaeota archaeon]
MNGFRKSLIFIFIFLISIINFRIALSEEKICPTEGVLSVPKDGGGLALPINNILSKGVIRCENNKFYLEHGDFAKINEIEISAKTTLYIEFSEKKIENIFNKEEKNYVKISKENFGASGSNFSTEFYPGKILLGAMYVLNPDMMYLDFSKARNGRYFYTDDGRKSERETCGKNCQQVKIIQRLVGVEENGIYDDKTINNIKIWQKENCILIDGKFGPQSLWYALNEDKTRKIKINYKKEGRALISKSGDCLVLKLQGNLEVKVGSREFILENEKVSWKIKNSLQRDIDVPIKIIILDSNGKEKQKIDLGDSELISLSENRNNVISNVIQIFRSAKTGFNIFLACLIKDEKKIEDIQKKFDEINKKINLRKDLSKEEVGFLKDFYYALGYGSIPFAPEASELLRHYLKGSGKTIEMDKELYEQSCAFKEAQKLLIRKIRKDIERNPLKEGEKRSIDTKRLTPQIFSNCEGARITEDGYVLTESNNLRAKMANNKYVLSATYRKVSGKVEIEWLIADKYFFKSPEEYPDYATPFKCGDKTLKVPHAVSRYLEEIAGAKPFYYVTRFSTECC